MKMSLTLIAAGLVALAVLISAVVLAGAGFLTTRPPRAAEEESHRRADRAFDRSNGGGWS